MIHVETSRLARGATNWGRLARGARESLAIIGCYAVSGLAWAAIAENPPVDPPEIGDGSALTIYAGGVTDEPSHPSRVATPPAGVAGARPDSSTQLGAVAGAGGDSGSDRVSDEASHKVSDKGSDKGSDRDSDRDSDKDSDKGSDKDSDKGSDVTPTPLPSIWLVDGFNVLHAGLLGGQDRSKWWTEPRRQALLDRVKSFEDPEAELWIVFDGSREAPATARPRCVFAPSADVWLVERVREAANPNQIAVVTADRQVAGRARGRGAQVFSPREFLARCPVDSDSGPI